MTDLAAASRHTCTDTATPPEQARWARVIKAVSKRRFAFAGAELPLAAEPVAGCDVEVIHVMAGQVRAWSLAYAAFPTGLVVASAPAMPAWQESTT